MAKQNNVANNLQILKEVATFRSERDAQKNVKKSLGKLTTNVVNQKKHNKGAAASRMRIEEHKENLQVCDDSYGGLWIDEQHRQER